MKIKILSDKYRTEICRYMWAS